MLLHHTSEPLTGKDRKPLTGNELAYLGTGSAEWVNWARAMSSIRGRGSHDVFELNAGKRGTRLGWTDEQGERTFLKLIAHAKEPGVICWRDAAESDLPATGRPRKFSPDDLLRILGTDRLGRNEWMAKCTKELRMSETTFKTLAKELRRSERVFNSPTDGKYEVNALKV
jgi:hypothetical protein